MDKLIAHVDMDAFFASVEQRDNPDLRGRPVVVGADPKQGKGRGVVSTCSYEARKFGIHSALPISLAYQRCPAAVFLPVNMEKYSQVSGRIYRIFDEFTPLVEPVSIDEAFLDLTETFHIFGTPHQACVLIKSRIKEETGLTASVGLAPTKMAAKIASDLKKPDGLVEVDKKGLLDFLWPLEIGRISGLGKITVELLHARGIRTIGDLAEKDLREAAEILGKSGVSFWQLANGIDGREVETGREAKSVSNESTFEADTLDKERIGKELVRLCEKVAGRMREEGLKCRTITLKIRLEGFQTYTRSLTLARPTNFDDILCKQIKQLYNNFDGQGKKVRLVGVKASGLVPANEEESLFKDNRDSRKEQVYKAIDKIKEKFGDTSILRGGRV